MKGAKLMKKKIICTAMAVTILLAQTAFNTIHDSLLQQITPSNEWYNIEPLLPPVAFYNQWDRCKRIRKAIKQKGYKIKEIEKYDTDLDIYLL